MQYASRVIALQLVWRTRTERPQASSGGVRHHTVEPISCSANFFDPGTQVVGISLVNAAVL